MLERIGSITLDIQMAMLGVVLYWIIWLMCVAIWLVRRIERLTNGIWLLANWIAYLRASETSSTESRNEWETTGESV